MNGVLPLLKPPGMSSQEAVTHVRRLAGGAKAGHAGTLDPEAAGVLPVLIGRATKLSGYLMQGCKEYVAELCVGAGTDTLDSEGMVTAVSPVRFSAAQLEEILPRFTGRIEQLPPLYSAVKVGGRPLYVHARAGRRVDVPSRMVQVDGIRLLSSIGDRFLLQIACRQGTYIRTLLSDLAQALGTVGYTSFLLRTRAAHLELAQTVALEELTRETLPAHLIAPERAVHLETIHLPQHLFRVLDSGAAIDMRRVHGIAAVPGTDYAVYCGGTFFGIGRLEERGLVLSARIKL